MPRADRTAYYAAYYRRHRQRKLAASLAYYRAHRADWLESGRHYRAANILPRKVARVLGVPINTARQLLEART